MAQAPPRLHNTVNIKYITKFDFKTWQDLQTLQQQQQQNNNNNNNKN